MNGERHHSLYPLQIIFLFIRARSGFALANSGFAFEGTTVFRCGIATEGITVFRYSIATEGITVSRCSIAAGRITVIRCGVATGGITVFRSSMLPRITRALANSGFAFEGTTVFRRGIATGGITVFRSRMLPLIARRRRDRLKLMLSAVCCDKFLTLWDLVNSVFEVSFWRKPLIRRQ